MSTTSEADEIYTSYQPRLSRNKSGRGSIAATSTSPLASTPMPTTAPPPRSKSLVVRAGIIPLGPTFLVTIAVTLSLLFIIVIACAFIPDDGERLAFASMLNDVAANTPGIVLIGDNVDVDVDEPALTIRWSIIACGEAYVLSGSEGIHGSQSCGLPAMSLRIYVDGGQEPAAVYDPSALPLFQDDGKRHSIQNMFTFDDDHVLDVHTARLYPFDAYFLTSTVRAVSVADNITMPIQKLVTITLTSSFVSMSNDSSSFVKAPDGTEQPSRDLDLQVYRPAEARTFTMLLFGVSWMLAHTTVGLVALSWRLDDADKVLRHLASTFVIILTVPQLRNAMPDAPGFDGVLIDAIGFFPQMVICSASAVVLFSMMVKRELLYLEDVAQTTEERKEAPAPLSTGLQRMRRGGVSVDISHVRKFSRSIAGFGMA